MSTALGRAQPQDVVIRGLALAQVMALLDLSQHRCDDTENVKAAQLGRRPHRCMHLCVESARHGSNGWFPGLLHWRRMSFPAMLNPGSMEQGPLIVRLFVRTAVALAAAALAAIAHTPAASSLPKAEERSVMTMTLRMYACMILGKHSL